MNAKTNRLLQFLRKQHNSMYVLASHFPDVCCNVSAETCRFLLILVSLPGPTGKSGFGGCHRETKSARDLSVSLNPVAFRRAICHFAA